MNIFYTNKNPIVCADEHCIIHTRKMIVEYTQLLSTCKRLNNGIKSIVVRKGRRKVYYRLDNFDDDDLFYQATHVNHPSNIWLRDYTPESTKWLVTVLNRLCDNFYSNSGKRHKIQHTGLLDRLIEEYGIIEDCNNHDTFSIIPEPPVAAPEHIIEYSKKTSKTQAYKKLICEKLTEWREREKPLDTSFYQEPEWFSFQN